jgi:hypothetical protein
MSLGRNPETGELVVRPEAIPEEGTVAQAEVPGSEDDDEDDDSDGGLMRTQTILPEPGVASGLGPCAGASVGRGIQLSRLLEHDSEPMTVTPDMAPPSFGTGAAPSHDEAAAQAWAAYASGAAAWHNMNWAQQQHYQMQAFYQMQAAAAAGAAAAQAEGGAEGAKKATSSDAKLTEAQKKEAEAALPEIGAAPPFGFKHSFHQETKDMGTVSSDFRQFTKVGYEGRLSVVSESRVHSGGIQRYLIQFSGGELSRADGLGFMFSPRLPCAKNIQRIVSLFLNQRGQICMRVFSEVTRASTFLRPLEIGDWIEMIIDLEKLHAIFQIWQIGLTGWPDGAPVSKAEFTFGDKLADVVAGADKQKPVKLNVGHFACVVKNQHVTVTLGS